MQHEGSLDDVEAAQARLEQARSQLRGAVTGARTHEYTWAQIGEVLGMTRQAAFRRCGSPRDPRTEDTMHPTAMTEELIERTEHILRLIDANNYDALLTMMSKDTAAVLARNVVLNTWAQAVTETGNLTGCLAGR